MPNTDVQRKVKAVQKKPEKTFEQMLLEMKNNRVLEYVSGIFLEEPLIKKQKDILQGCGIEKDAFAKRILQKVL